MPATVPGFLLVPRRCPTRLTKIQATLGPSSCDVDTVRRMVEAGMDASRLNMSHCSHEMGRQIIEAVRTVEAETGLKIPVGADLRGPKLRIGDAADGAAVLVNGSTVVVTTEPCLSDASRVSVDYRDLVADLRPEDRILLHDGFLSLHVQEIREADVVCVVERGGQLLPRKGVNLPGIPLRVPSVTKKDLEDIAFAVTADVDFLFVSYARSKRHIQEVRAAVRRHGVDLPLVAKIERQDGVDALGEIVAAADGICVARGDLGIEVPIETLPGIQRDAARLCLDAGKFVMMGGQVLSSMVSSPIPLRAEVADLAAVVRDHLDAIVLSDETASGEYPVEAVAAAARVFEEAERYERRHGSLRAEPGLAAPTRR